MRVGKIFLSLFFGLLIIFSVSFWGISNLRADDETITVGAQVVSICGNDLIETGEDCDGDSLNSNTCTTLDLDYVSGVLACSSLCFFDVSKCNKSTGGEDTTPPTIADISTSTSVTTGTVNWTADDDSGIRSCSFEYGEDESYGLSVTPSNIGINYIASLSGLSSETNYYFKITCIDNSSNSNSGFKTGSLETLAPPEGELLLNLVSTSTSFSTATVKWTANSQAGIEVCNFDYGEDESYSLNVNPTHVDNLYIVSLSGLSSSTTYNFNISCESNDDVAESLVGDFTTKINEDVIIVTVDLTVLACPEKRGGSNNSVGGLLVFYDPVQKVTLGMKQIDIDTNGYHRNNKAKLPEHNNLAVYFKGRSHLAKKITGVNVVAGASLVLNFTDDTNLNFGNFKLKAGDVQGSWPGLKDNFVDVLDLSAVDVRLNQMADFDADLNNDNIVDVLDMSMVLGNFNLGGDVLP